MTRTEALSRLRAHRDDLHAMGIAHVAIFGSTARGEEGVASDLDLAVRLRPEMRFGWEFASLEDRIGTLLGVAVDIVTEPTRRPRLQAEIDRDRIDAF